MSSGVSSFCRFSRADDEDYEWAEGPGWLGTIIPLRAELMRGDLRILYLGWLLGVQMEEVDEEELEPPVPHGLGALEGPLLRAAEFLRIDIDLIASAAEQSADRRDTPLAKKELDRWINRLAAKERNALLAELISSDDPHLVAEIRRRALLEVRGAATPATAPRRRAVDLLGASHSIG